MENDISNERTPNPLDKSNIISRIFFCWLIPYILKGYKRELNEDDISKHRKSHETTLLGNRLEVAWKNEITNQEPPSLLRALWKVFYVEFIFLNMLPLFSELLKLSNPFIISKLMQLYEKIDEENIKQEVYFYSLVLVIANFFNVLVFHFYNIEMCQVGMKMRIAISSLVYRKTLKLSKEALVETTIGQVVNLLTNDVARFDFLFHQIYFIWLAPLMNVAVIYFSYTSYGFIGMSGTLALLAALPLQIYLGKKTSQFRLSTALRTDERVRLMNEIINGIQVIKMYTWEKPFAKLIQIVRLNELKNIRFASLIRGFLAAVGQSNNRLSISIAIIVYVATGNTLTSTYAYTIISYYRILNIVNIIFPWSISCSSELYTGIQRLQTFLIQKEKIAENEQDFKQKNDYLIEQGVKVNEDHVDCDVICKLTNITAKWIKPFTENNLENVSMEIKSGCLVAVVGPVGSGKSTLFQVILNELEPSGGTLEVNGTISYASQEPWLFGGTIRQNILFGQTFNKKRYDEVIRVCALDKDFTQFIYRDKTRIGERGATLSGGQKARVNLARAVYKEADVYLLDDPLSAVDSHVGKQLFDLCICDFLKNKSVVLVTHQLQYLHNIKQIYLLEDGRISSSGSYEDLKNSKSILTQLLTTLEKDEAKMQIEIRKRSILPKEVDEDEPDLKKEGKSSGKVTSYVYFNYFRSGGNLCKIFLIILAFILNQFLDSFAEYFVNTWVNVNQIEFEIKDEQMEDGNDTVIVTNTIDSYDDWIIDFFTGNHTVYIYGGIVTIFFVISIIRAEAFYLWSLSCSTRLHNKMFDNIIHSPMLFFNTNPCGRILNRFSNDMGVIDEQLPVILADTVYYGLNILSICLIIGSLNPWIILTTVVTIIIFYLMRLLYMESSRDIKRLEAIMRSPIFSHLAASFQGLTTIRAFKAQELLASEFDKLQNLHNGAFFLYVGAVRTFSFWLDFSCSIYVTVVLAILIFVKEETFGGNIGLALTQATALTGVFQGGLRQWSELENKMTSVERVQEYVELSKEIENETEEPPETWPEYGQIVFNKLSLRYSYSLPYVLKNINFVIKPKEKIGVVGRTGAGKSSIIQALFRLANIEGTIIIDGVDTKTITLNKLRSKISIIPQEPVLFSGTVRRNLDPFNEYADEVLWSALEDVDLKSTISDLPDNLNNKMAEGGTNFSVGQRQLLCLARAIIRQNKILILDEATANVDLHTDGLIQCTIREKFTDCTVVTIAHRLNTIMDSDKVMVMDAGEIVEYDSPHVLLQNKNGIFYSLLMQTGANSAKNLMKMARSAHELRDQNDDRF